MPPAAPAHVRPSVSGAPALRGPARRRQAAGRARSRTTRRSAPIPRHFAYWRRAGRRRDSGVVAETPGLRSRARGRRRRTSDGITLTQRVGRGRRPQRAVRARTRMGRFAGADLRRTVAGPRPAARPAAPASSGAAAGRPSPGRRSPTSPTSLWARRETSAPRSRRAAPGAPARRPGRANLPGRDGDDVVAIDWGTLGHGPGRRGPRLPRAQRARGRSSRCSTPTCWGCPTVCATREEVLLGARVTAVYTALSRRRVGAGPGRARARGRSPGSSGTPAWRRTSARSSGSSRTSRRCSSQVRPSCATAGIR